MCAFAAPSRLLSRSLAAGVLVAGAVAGGCAGTSPDENVGAEPAMSGGTGVPQVFVASYPLAFLATEVGGDEAHVTDLVSGAGDAHHAELTPKQVQEMAGGDLIVYLGGGFQPAVEKAVETVAGSGTPSLDLRSTLDASDLIDGDPHVWLNPLLVADMGEALAERLAEIAPEHADYYRQNAQELRGQLEEIDGEYKEALSGCAGQTILTSHEAFGYMAQRYGIEQMGVLGLDPDAEPSPARLAEINRQLTDLGVKVLFVEPAAGTSSGGDGAVSLGEPSSSGAKVAQTLGLDAVPLDTLEVQRDADLDFLEILRANLQSLRSGLACAN